jgi:hypothetical protein
MYPRPPPQSAPRARSHGGSAAKRTAATVQMQTQRQQRIALAYADVTSAPHSHRTQLPAVRGAMGSPASETWGSPTPSHQPPHSTPPAPNMLRWVKGLAAARQEATHRDVQQTPTPQSTNHAPEAPPRLPAGLLTPEQFRQLFLAHQAQQSDQEQQFSYQEAKEAYYGTAAQRSYRSPNGYLQPQQPVQTPADLSSTLPHAHYLVPHADVHSSNSSFTLASEEQAHARAREISEAEEARVQQQARAMRDFQEAQGKAHAKISGAAQPAITLQVKPRSVVPSPALPKQSASAPVSVVAPMQWPSADHPQSAHSTSLSDSPATVPHHRSPTSRDERGPGSSASKPPRHSKPNSPRALTATVTLSTVAVQGNSNGERSLVHQKPLVIVHVDAADERAVSSSVSSPRARVVASIPHASPPAASSTTPTGSSQVSSRRSTQERKIVVIPEPEPKATAASPPKADPTLLSEQTSASHNRPVNEPEPELIAASSPMAAQTSGAEPRVSSPKAAAPTTPPTQSPKAGSPRHAAATIASEAKVVSPKSAISNRISPVKPAAPQSARVISPKSKAASRRSTHEAALMPAVVVASPQQPAPESSAKAVSGKSADDVVAHSPPGDLSATQDLSLSDAASATDDQAVSLTGALPAEDAAVVITAAADQLDQRQQADSAMTHPSDSPSAAWAKSEEQSEAAHTSAPLAGTAAAHSRGSSQVSTPATEGAVTEVAAVEKRSAIALAGLSTPLRISAPTSPRSSQENALSPAASASPRTPQMMLSPRSPARSPGAPALYRRSTMGATTSDPRSEENSLIAGSDWNFYAFHQGSVVKQRCHIWLQESPHTSPDAPGCLYYSTDGSRTLVATQRLPLTSLREIIGNRRNHPVWKVGIGAHVTNELAATITTNTQVWNIELIPAPGVDVRTGGKSIKDTFLKNVYAVLMKHKRAVKAARAVSSASGVASPIAALQLSPEPTQEVQYVSARRSTMGAVPASTGSWAAIAAAGARKAQPADSDAAHSSRRSSQDTVVTVPSAGSDGVAVADAAAPTSAAVPASSSAVSSRRSTVHVVAQSTPAESPAALVGRSSRSAVSSRRATAELPVSIHALTASVRATPVNSTATAEEHVVAVSAAAVRASATAPCSSPISRRSTLDPSATSAAPVGALATAAVVFNEADRESLVDALSSTDVLTLADEEAELDGDDLDAVLLAAGGLAAAQHLLQQLHGQGRQFKSIAQLKNAIHTAAVAASTSDVSAPSAAAPAPAPAPAPAAASAGSGVGAAAAASSRRSSAESFDQSVSSISDMSSPISESDREALVESLLSTNVLQLPDTEAELTGEEIDELLIAARGVQQAKHHLAHFQRLGRIFRSVAQLLEAMQKLSSQRKRFSGEREMQ